jgi:23S rRNA pseudouridine955/2504/2580 synthase
MNDLVKPAPKVLEIGDDSAGQRLDNFLQKVLKGAPKSLIYRIIRSGEVRVNKGRAKPDTRLAVEDRVRVPPIEVEPQRIGPVAAGAVRAGEGFPVLLEDDSLLAINKPAGVAVHGGSGLRFGVIEALRAARPQARFLELVHRLDRDTSGILLLAKKRPFLVALHELLREGRIDKRYLALVKGVWPHEAKHHIVESLASYVTQGGERRVSQSSHEGAREAHSVVSVAKRYAEATLLEVTIKTGRTHQIRVHLASAGHPILGDDKYGDFEINRQAAKAGLKRMFLHAARISFLRPDNGERVRIEAGLTAECEAYLGTLSRLAKTA